MQAEADPLADPPNLSSRPSQLRLNIFCNIDNSRLGALGRGAQRKARKQDSIAELLVGVWRKE